MRFTFAPYADYPALPVTNFPASTRHARNLAFGENIEISVDGWRNGEKKLVTLKGVTQIKCRIYLQVSGR